MQNEERMKSEQKRTSTHPKNWFSKIGRSVFELNIAPQTIARAPERPPRASKRSRKGFTNFRKTIDGYKKRQKDAQ